MRIKFDKLYNDVITPHYAHIADTGADVFMYKDIEIKHGKNIIPLGFTCIIPQGYAGFLSLRSSIMGNGVICNMTPFDPDYKGEWNRIVYNCEDSFIVKKCERICQLLVIPTQQCEFIDSNTYDSNIRGSGGQGSTGK